MLGTVTEQVLAGREEAQLLELVEEVLARDPEQITALRLLVRIHWWQRDMDRLRAALERLTEAAEAAGKPEDERYALTQLVRLVPDATRYAERLAELGGAQEEFVDEASMPIAAGFEDVPAFSDFAIVGEDAFGSCAETPVVAEHHEEFESNSVTTEGVFADQIPDPSASFADLNDEFERAETSAAVPAVESAPQASEYGEVDFSSTIPEATSDSLTETDPPRGHVAPGVGERRFHIGQGYRTSL